MDTFALVADERRRLADELEQLTDDEWVQPSRCDGWSAHVVAAHLNLPWAVSSPTFLLGVVRARGNIDRAMDRFSREAADRLTSAECVASLRANAEHRFTPPGSGPEAPLTDVVIHGADLLQPLGRSVAVSDEALVVVLTWLGNGVARGFLPRSRVAGLRFEGTDVDVRAGAGPSLVAGPALAVCSALLGRRSALTELHGDGVALLAARL